MSRCLFALCLAASVLGSLSSFARACSPSAAKLVAVTYPVADLVVPIDTSPVVLTIGKEAKAERACPSKAARTTETELIGLITSTVTPAGWQAKGGRGAISYEPVTMSLLVNQTQQVQDQVAHLLSALRRQQVEVATEVRLVRVREALLEQGKVSLQGATPKLLSASEMKTLLGAIQGDRDSSVMQAPKMTSYNGVQVRISDLGDGYKLDMQPTVSADRRSVHLSVSLGVQTEGVKGNISAMLDVPDGGTVLLPGWSETREVQREVSPPCTNKIPYLNRLFKNVGYARETFRVLVLVTPRVIAAEEEEAVLSKVAEDQPSEAEVLRALPPGKRENVSIVYEKLADRVAQPLFAPLVGPSKLQLCSWKCTVYSEDVIHSDCPFRFESHFPKVEVVYVGTEKPEAIWGGQEESEEPPVAAGKVEQLVEEYHQACAAGDTEKAKELARRALKLDPKCFHAERGQ
jgi:hypothetical protein